MTVVQSDGALVAAQRPWLPSGTWGTHRAGIDLFDGSFAAYAEMYRTQPNLRLVVKFLARNIAQLGIKTFERVDDIDRRPLPATHELTRLLRRPNPYTTKHAFVDALVHDLKVYDTYFALKVRNTVTGQMSLFRLPPHLVQPYGGTWLLPDGYRLLGASEQPVFPREAVFTLHGYNPEDPRIGLSPIESLRQILAEGAAAAEWREQYWRNAARTGGIIERPLEAPKWSDTARSRFRADFQATYAGTAALAGATPILEEGMIWKDATFSPKDSEYLGARRLSREETAAQYFVSPLFVGVLENANFSNVAEQHKHLYQDTLGPDLDWIEEELALQLLPDFPDLDADLVYFEFNLAEKLKGTFEEQATVLQTMVGAPIMTRNEGRARLNLSPLPGGDQLVTPLNVLTGGQASPRDSAPPPGTASRALKQRAPMSGWHAKHVEVLTGFFDRQRAAVTARLGAGWTVADAFDDDRWNGELGDDLVGLATTMTAELATGVAERFGGTFDETRTAGYLTENARIAAENINATTKAQLAAAFPSTPAGLMARKDTTPLLDDGEEDTDPMADVAGVFDLAVGARAAEIATTRVASTAGFAEHEGASQAGVPYKVWNITSPRPRQGHPGNGETVPMGEAFSNGARWPGDPDAGVDQVAGCTCTLDFTTEEP